MVSIRRAVAGIAIMVLAGVLLGFLLLFERPEEQSMAEPAAGNTSSIDIGITYIQITPSMAEYYGLGIDSGVLITEVLSGSLAEQGGVLVGDVILSFNGVSVEQGTPLFGMMQACTAGTRISMDIWRAKSHHIIEFVHNGEHNGMRMMH